VLYERIMKILVVEDEAYIRLFISANLRARGFEVVEAESAEIATSLLTTSKPPELILLDVLLPDMLGWDFARWLARKAQFKHIPVILVTASLADYKTEYEYPNITQRYMKPLSTDDLLAAVHHLTVRNNSLF
jgi:DNA-binding response OmpR family regulator